MSVKTKGGKRKGEEKEGERVVWREHNLINLRQCDSIRAASHARSAYKANIWIQLSSCIPIMDINTYNAYKCSVPYTRHFSGLLIWTLIWLNSTIACVFSRKYLCGSWVSLCWRGSACSLLPWMTKSWDRRSSMPLCFPQNFVFRHRHRSAEIWGHFGFPSVK